MLFFEGGGGKVGFSLLLSNGAPALAILVVTFEDIKREAGIGSQE